MDVLRGVEEHLAKGIQIGRENAAGKESFTPFDSFGMMSLTHI